MKVVGRRPIRVLHLRDSPWIDGPGRTILETAARIDRERVDYQIGALVADSASSHPLVDAAQERGLPVHAIADRGDSLRLLVDQVAALIDELGIDILHTSEFRSNVIGLMCRRRRPVRLVSTVHGWIENELRGRAKAVLDRLLLRRFDHLILVSHAMRRRLPAWWVPDTRVTVIHNALDVGSYGREWLHRIRSVPGRGDEITILNVGRLSEEKGQALLVRAVAELSSEYSQLRLAFAGSGPLERELGELADALGIRDRVKFIGYVIDMPAIYSSVDLVVQSSKTEGMPNVMLEAAYLGVPVVATNVGGTSEVIEHGVTGWLVAPRSLGALVDGIRQYLEQPAEFVGMAKAGRARIAAEFSIEGRTIAQTAVYEGLCGARA